LSSLGEVDLTISIWVATIDSLIQEDIAYVDAFSETWMLFNSEHAIDMGLLGGIRTSSFYSQLGRAVHFLLNFLTRSIVILMLLPVSTTKFVIDILFATLHCCLPVCNQQDIQEHILGECKGPWHAAECVPHCNLHGMHCSDQSLIDNVSSLC
jgi:hypothetical protein